MQIFTKEVLDLEDLGFPVTRGHVSSDKWHGQHFWIEQFGSKWEKASKNGRQAGAELCEFVLNWPNW